MTPEEKKEQRRLYEIEYRKKNAEKKKEQNKVYYENNKNKHKNYYEENKEQIKQQAKEYRKVNKNKISEQRKEYRKTNKDKINEYFKNRRDNDVIFKLSCLIRSNISTAIKRINHKKQSKTELILGCTFAEFKQYLESKFEDWQNWDNYGLYNGTANYGWDIDHIVPQSSGLTYDEIIKLNHYTNLKPLCSFINRDIKKDKI